MISATGELEFPFSDLPVAGEATEIRPGLFWVRMPLPFRLDHVNVWLLKETDGWTVIDTGCATPTIFDAWENLLAGPMGGMPVRRLLATHGHVDHIGLAGWLVERFQAEFVGTFTEWMWARLSHMHGVPGSDDEHNRFLIRHGFDEVLADRMLKSRHRFMDLSSDIPSAITEIRDGDMIRFGGRDWRVLVTRGHAFEHASFYCADENIIVAGDHLLPRISPVIAVYEMVPKGDPLGDYLASFGQFAGIPHDVLVLPSHGIPYKGIHARIHQLREHHDARLEETASLLGEPKSARALTTAMFPHVEGPENIWFALGEVLAHLNHLVQTGTVSETADGDGRLVYHRR